MLVNTQFELSKLVLINEQQLLFSLSAHLNPASADQIHSITNFFRQALLFTFGTENNKCGYLSH